MVIINLGSILFIGAFAGLGLILIFGSVRGLIDSYGRKINQYDRARPGFFANRRLLWLFLVLGVMSIGLSAMIYSGTMTR